MDKNIKNDDLLGRGAYRSREAKKARSNHIMYTIFREKEGNNLLSVDRFGFCGKEKLTAIQDRVAENRSKLTQRSFYGWAQVSAKRACENGRRVRSTPLPSNPYHADIILPEDITRDDQIAHAKELASYAEWIPRKP